MKRVLIVGAKSDIGMATALEYAKNGFDLYLASRNNHELNDFANIIRSKTDKKVTLLELDILDYKSHYSFYHNLQIKPVGIVSSVGYLGNQEKAALDFTETSKIIDTNYTGIVNLLNIISNDFKRQKSGFIVGISSVAGERGKKVNLIYSSAKAGFTAYLSGLRNDLSQFNIHVMTVIPGYVKTKMIEHLNTSKFLTATPEAVAKAIYNGQQNKKNTIYIKWIWKYIMIIVKLIPERIFKNMNI